MGPIEDSLREAFLPALFGGEDISADLIEILGYSMKRGSLGIPDLQVSAECVYNTSKSASEVLVGSLLEGTNLNYIVHKGCVCRDSADGRNQREIAEKALLSRRKYLADREGMNCLRWEMENEAWLTAIPNLLNGA